MIRRLSSLALGCAVALSGASAFAQDEEEEAAPAEEAPAAEASAATGGTAEASVEGLPEGKGLFGKAGQIAISSDFELSFESRSFAAPDDPPGQEDPESETTITIAPALDYFVIDSLSVGGQIAFSRSSQGDDSAQFIGFAPRVGYNLGLTDNLSLWPKLKFQYAMFSATITDPTGAEQEFDGSKMTIGVDVPLLIHPVEHFFIGIGPYFEMDLSSKVEDNDSVKDTAFGVRTVIGGWF